MADEQENPTLQPESKTAAQESPGAPNSGTTESAEPVLESFPMVSAEGDLADPRLPDEGDWGNRPYSPSEFFVEPGIEQGLADTLMANPANGFAWAGLICAVLGFLPGIFGLMFPLLALVLGGTGVVAGLRGAKRLPVAVASILVALSWITLRSLSLT